MYIKDILLFGATEAESASGIGALGIEPKAFIIQLITWLFVFLVLLKFVFKPIVKILDNRRKTIEDGVRLTTELAAEREKLEAQIAEAHKKARAEAQELMNQAKDQANVALREAEEATQAKVESMISDAKKKINEETEKARRSLEEETVNLVIKATEAVSREKLDPKKDAVLIKDALEGRI